MFGYTSAGTRQSSSETRMADTKCDSIKLAPVDRRADGTLPHTPRDRIKLVPPSDPVDQPPITESPSGGECRVQARPRLERPGRMSPRR